MRRSPLALLLLLPFTAGASAQHGAVIAPAVHTAPAVEVAPVAGGVRAVRVKVRAAAATSKAPIAQADDIVARLMTFDRNQDGLVASDELLDRMRHLVERGDADGNGALDGNELRTLASRPPAPVTVTGFPFGGNYGFADEFDVSFSSSRSHIEGAIEDLRLDGPVEQRALAVATAFADALEDSAAATLLDELDDLLTADQVADFSEALENQGTNGHTMTHVKDVTLTAGRRIAFLGTDLAHRLDQYGLAPQQKSAARAAVERYKARLRPGEVERSLLLDRLQDVLSDEARDDLRAALERRPVVQRGGVIFFSRDGAAIVDQLGRVASSLNGNIVVHVESAGPAVTLPAPQGR
jgi:hypothetical protein